MTITHETLTIDGEDWRFTKRSGVEISRELSRPYTPSAPPIRKISKLAFFVRLDTAVPGIEDTLRADVADPATGEAKRTHLRRALRGFDLTPYIDLDHADTVSLVAVLAGYGYFTADQATALRADGSAAEAWRE